MKLNGELDLDWSEISEKHGLGISGDHLRKMGYGVKLVSDNGLLKEDADDMETLNRIQIEKQKVRDIRREIRASLSTMARSEAIRESLVDAIKELNELDTRTFVIGTNENREKELVLCVSDMHYGAEWNVEGLNGETINEYNPEIFETRMCNVLMQVANICKEQSISHICVLLGGDSLDGMLRNSQLMKLRYGVIESTIRFSEFMAEWLNALAKKHKVRVYSVDGNHTEIRPLGSSRGEFEKENMEKIIAWYLKERLRNNENIEIDDKTTKTKLIDVLGYKILLAHGDEYNSIERIITENVLLYGESLDMAIVGHRHNERMLTSGYNKQGSVYILQTPSICGIDGYAKGKRMGGSAGAIAMVIERGYGRKCTYPIKLD